MDTKELIEETVEQIFLDGNWPTPEGMTDDEFEGQVKKIVEKYTNEHFDPDEDEIDDYEEWEQDIIIALRDLYDE